MKDRVWFITGCATGIGNGIAKAALSAGDSVILTARNAERLEKLHQEYPNHSVVIPLDVTDNFQREQAVRRAIECFGRIDVLVNNAGYGYRAAIEESEADEIKRLFDVNVFAPIELIKLILPDMRKRKSGLIINITSIGGIRGAVCNGMYSAAKGAMELASDTLYKECEPLGIKVMTVEPGAFRTAFYDNLRGTSTSIDDYADTAGKWHTDKITNNRDQLGDPDKAGEIIVQLSGMSELPKHFALGSDAVNVIETEYSARLEELHKWADMSRRTDHTD